ncbi:MAG: hypothetical protein HY355_04485 [Armatimonadetes bacterium]|nr:hypothetical protein [Armatimonadota bacterium]
MLIGFLLLLALSLALIVYGWIQRKTAAELRRRLHLAAPYLVRSGAPFAEIEPLVNFPIWKVIGRGGNLNPGKIGGLGLCPCQMEYTVANNQVILAAWPNPAAVAACVANPPAPDAAEWECPDDCVQVMTHLWRGWEAVQNVQNGQIRLNCYTFAQYHCKKPDDPDRHKPPRPTDPGDTTPEV